MALELAPNEGPRHRPGGRGGEAADAADRRPRQAGGAVRRHLPADRLRAVERRELRLPQGRRAHPVQVAQPGPARHPDLADVDHARQLRDAGAGAAAGRQALVPRQRRRDLPVPEPDPRREARHRRSSSAPTTCTGWTSPRWCRRTARAARPARWPRSGSRSGSPTSSASSTSTPTTRRGSATSSRSPPTRSACPTARARCSPRWATTSSTPTRCVEAVTRDATEIGSKHDMGGDIVPAFVRRQQAGVYDYKDNDVAGSTDRDRGYWRDVGTLGSYYAAHMDVVSPLPIFNLYNFDWPIYTSYGPQPPAKLVQGAGGATVLADEAVLSPGVVVTGGTGTPLGALAGGARRLRGRGGRLGADERRARRRGRRGAQRDRGQERRGPAGRAARGRPARPTAPAASWWRTGSPCSARTRHSQVKGIAATGYRRRILEWRRSR